GPVDKGVLQCVCTVGRFFFAHGGADMGDKFSISRRRLLQAGNGKGLAHRGDGLRRVNTYWR
ncbi:hypothetical protein FK521_27495, partial [Klebsiella pneumoniae]|nr:hypothetical protein [Klebsiella pneumoniae]